MGRKTAAGRAKAQHTSAQSSATSASDAADTPSSRPVYFWRETEPETGYLSQWYPCAFTDEEGTVYKSAEHYMMYHKARLFSSSSAAAAAILAASHPGEAKALGRGVAGFSEEVWRAQREAIVRRGNMLKFTRPADRDDGLWRPVAAAAAATAGGAVGEEAREGEGGTERGPGPPDLRELLLGTGERELVEASPGDRIWGIGFTAAKAERAGRERWGLNLLGKALMVVREELRREEQEGKGEEGDENQKKERV